MLEALTRCFIWRRCIDQERHDLLEELGSERIHSMLRDTLGAHCYTRGEALIVLLSLRDVLK